MLNKDTQQYTFLGQSSIFVLTSQKFDKHKETFVVKNIPTVSIHEDNYQSP